MPYLLFAKCGEHLRLRAIIW